MLKLIIFFVDLVKNLPGDIKLDPLLDHLEVVSVLALFNHGLSPINTLLDMIVIISLGLLHFFVENLVILVSDTLISDHLLLVRNDLR